MEARRAHNPEVVGSSPASATIKTPDFDTKFGVFLTFYGMQVYRNYDRGDNLGTAPIFVIFAIRKNQTI